MNRLANPYWPPLDEHEQVLAWRTERLLELGYPVDQALHLADRPDVDVHELEQLIHRGCTPETAARILG